MVYMISCQGLCAHNELPYPELQFTATNFMSMAAKSSDLVDKTPGANFRQMATQKCQPKVQRTYRSQRNKIVPFPLAILVSSPEAAIQPP